MKPVQYPFIAEGCKLEIPRPRNGRPSYVWVRGWVVCYSDSRQSCEMRLNDARGLLREAKKA